jgi:transcription initiation factor TFIIIB Brf1 subunit/transcription initiation factor TFIIB
MAAAVLYGACLAQGEKLHQVQLAEAANLSVVTLRKRLQDVRKVFPEVPNGPSKSVYTQPTIDFLKATALKGRADAPIEIIN